MKKKVLYGVALALFASVSVGTLQSCKDDLNDLKTQTTFDLATLRAQLDSETARLQSQIDANAGNIATIMADYAKLSYVNQKLGELETAYKEADAKLREELVQKIADEIDGAISTLQTTEIDPLKTKVADLETKLVNYDQIVGIVEANKAAIETLQSDLKDLKGYTETEIEQLNQNLAQANELINQIYQSLNDSIGEVKEELQENVAKLNDRINALINQFNSQVTGILIQSVSSPVFGDFSLPIGIKSNILFNWYGYNQNKKDLVFPSSNTAFVAYGDPSGIEKLTPKKTETIPSGYYGDVELGKVYVTLNPVNAVFNDLELSIENSGGDRLPMMVTLNPSDEVLYHGYSRSAENGFYEGVVTLPQADIPSVRLEIDQNLKTAMKDALKDRTKRSAVALVKAVYDQMSGLLPAYALRYDWTTNAIPSLEDTDPNYSVVANAVLSQYDLAVATAKPLSFNFLADKSVSHKLPTLSPMENLIQKLIDEGTFSINLKPIEIQGANITIKPIEIDANVEVKGGSLVVKIPEIIVDLPGGATGTTRPKDVTVEGNDLNSVYKAIEDGIKDALGNVQNSVNGWTGTMQTELNGQMNDILGDVQSQVNNMITSINGQIDDMLENVANKFDGVFNKINRVFDIYNKIANKVNNILDDPNAYLQVTALYSMGGNYGFVSGDVNHPTTFNAAGGNAFKLYLTSYTGELIVPAYKKYVAITGVYQNGQAVNADLAALNAAADLNTALDGSRIGVLVPASNLDANNVYEFTYQAVDYNGFTSTRKFYIEVK